MESAVDNSYVQQQNFHGHWLQLERRWLMEDILPARELGTLLQQIKNHHMTTAASEWYYQNVHVEPLWDYGKQLAYRVVLPGMSSENYLAYKSKNFKVPVEGNHLRQILGNSRGRCQYCHRTLLHTISWSLYRQTTHGVQAGPFTFTRNLWIRLDFRNQA